MVKTIYNNGYRMVVRKLIDARNKKGMRQLDVGRKMMKSKQWVSRVEICQLRLDIVHFVQLCRICGVKPRRLIEALEESLEDSFLAMACTLYSSHHLFYPSKSISSKSIDNAHGRDTFLMAFVWIWTIQFCEFYKSVLRVLQISRFCRGRDKSCS
jgi:transcriptional regulator with XRE-family HTH domain